MRRGNTAKEVWLLCSSRFLSTVLRPSPMCRRVARLAGRIGNAVPIGVSLAERCMRRNKLLDPREIAPRRRNQEAFGTWLGREAALHSKKLHRLAVVKCHGDAFYTTP